MLGTPTQRLFLAAWLGGLVLFAGLWAKWGDVAAVAADHGALITLGIVLLVTPWVAGPGLLPLLRRRDSGGVNIPHAEYWFTGERRAASLDRLRPFLEVFGAMLSAFLSAVLMVFIGERTDPALAQVSALIFLAATVVYLGTTVIWVRSVMRAFPAPDPATRGVSTLGPRRRPGGPYRPQRPSGSGRSGQHRGPGGSGR